MYRKSWTTATSTALFAFPLSHLTIICFLHRQFPGALNCERKKNVYPHSEIYTRTFTHISMHAYWKQKVIIMDEQAAAYPCRCHCYALKKMLVFAAARIFYLPAAVKILGLVIICHIYGSSQILYSYLCSYSSHLKQDPLKSDPVIFHSPNVCAIIWA